MSNLYSVQGSISIKRLRNGDNLYLSLTSDKPLYQSINPDSIDIFPDFTNESNQPIITPHADSQMSPNIPLTGHVWNYNFQEIIFGTSEKNGFKVSTNHNGKFGLNEETGALRILGNLASKTNIGNDTFTYKGVATVQGIEYEVQKSIEFTIRTAASNPYDGFITVLNKDKNPDDAIIGDDGEDDILYLKTTLMNGNSRIPETGYTVEWKKDNEIWKNSSGIPVTGALVPVSRSDVNGSQLFIAEFKINNSEVAQTGIVISDILDDYQIRFTKVGDMVDNGKDVVVTANVYNTKSEKLITVPNNGWRLDVMDGTTWDEIRSEEDTNTIRITTNDTDVTNENGAVNYRDVVVIAEVEFELK